jgi:hypothetical protein
MPLRTIWLSPASFSKIGYANKEILSSCWYIASAYPDRFGLRTLISNRISSIVDEMPKPKEAYSILFSGDGWCGKTSLRARITGQALPGPIQLTFLHEFPIVECLVPKEDPELDEEAWREWRTAEGEVDGGWKEGKGKRRVKIETQENSLWRCYDGLEALNFISMDVVAICFSVGMKDTFEERLQVVSGDHFILFMSPQRMQSNMPPSAPRPETTICSKDTHCVDWASNRPKE